MFEILLGSDGSRRSRRPRRLQADPPARVADVACGQGYLDDRDRAGVSVRACRWHRSRRGVDRGRQENLAGSGLEDASPSTTGTQRTRVAGAVRPRLHARVAARHVLPGRVLARLPRPARRGRATSSSATSACADSFTALGRRRRAVLLRLQRSPLPAGRDGRRRRRGHRTVMRVGHRARATPRKRASAASRSLPIENDFYRLLPPRAPRQAPRARSDCPPGRSPSRSGRTRAPRWRRRPPRRLHAVARASRRGRRPGS